MHANIIKIGTSYGIRIPATVLNELNKPFAFALEMTKEGLLLRPQNSPRKGWDEAFMAMHQNGDDTLLEDDAIDLDLDSDGSH